MPIIKAFNYAEVVGMARENVRRLRRRDPSKMLDECELKIARLTLKMTREAMRLRKKRGDAPYII